MKFCSLFVVRCPLFVVVSVESLSVTNNQRNLTHAQSPLLVQI